MNKNEYEIEVLRGSHCIKKFQFTNIINEENSLEFVSSKPSLLQIRSENGTYNFKPHEKKEIEIYLPIT